MPGCLMPLRRTKVASPADGLPSLKLPWYTDPSCKVRAHVRVCVCMRVRVRVFVVACACACVFLCVVVCVCACVYL